MVYKSYSQTTFLPKLMITTDENTDLWQMMKDVLPLNLNNDDKLLDGINFNFVKTINKADKENRQDEFGQDSANNTFGVYSSFNYPRFPGIRYTNFSTFTTELEPFLKTFFPQFLVLYISTYNDCPSTHFHPKIFKESYSCQTNLICIHGTTRYNFVSRLSEDSSYSPSPMPSDAD